MQLSVLGTYYAWGIEVAAMYPCFHKSSHSIKGILTECELCTRKYLHEVFVQKTSFSAQKKTNANAFWYWTSKRYYNKAFIHRFLFIFNFVLTAVFVFKCCRLPYFWAACLTGANMKRNHSFPLLVDKQFTKTFYRV